MTSIDTKLQSREDKHTDCITCTPEHRVPVDTVVVRDGENSDPSIGVSPDELLRELGIWVTAASIAIALARVRGGVDLQIAQEKPREAHPGIVGDASDAVLVAPYRHDHEHDVRGQRHQRVYGEGDVQGEELDRDRPSFFPMAQSW